MKTYALIFCSLVWLFPTRNALSWNLFHQKTTAELCNLGCACPENDKSFIFLDCSRRGIKKLPPAITFDTQLMKVSFQGNGIKFLDKGTFYRAPSVEELDLSLNEISLVSESIFIGFNALAELNLAHNHLTSVPPGLLDGLNNLRILELGNNRLEKLPENLFESTRHLRELRLRFNNLRNIGANTFLWLPLLERLDLENTGLLEVPQNLFLVNLNLNWLSLADNSLTNVPTEAFRATKRLSSLDLSGNLFEILPPKSLATLTNLSHLIMNNLRHLKNIDKMAFLGMQNLKSLSCSYNDKLSTIHPEAFGRNATIPKEQLYLNHNNLKSLKIDFADVKQIGYMDLRGNPWNCDCKMMWMAELRWEIQETVRCKNPAGLRDQPLSSIPKEQLVCTTWLFSTTLLLFSAVLAFSFCIIAAAATFCPRNCIGARLRSKKQFKYVKIIPKKDSVDLEWDHSA